VRAIVFKAQGVSPGLLAFNLTACAPSVGRK